MHKLIFILLLVAFFNACKSDNKTTELTEKSSSKDLAWHSIEDIPSLAKAEKKGYFIDVYTDWCGWCKKMDKITFSDPLVKKAMANKYHVIKFNAEQKTAVNFNGKTYEFQGQGRNGVNLLAVELLQGELSFPSYVFLDEQFNIKKVARGFMTADAFLTEL